MRIHISESTFQCLQNANYLTRQRGSIDIKVNIYFHVWVSRKDLDDA